MNTVDSMLLAYLDRVIYAAQSVAQSEDSSSLDACETYCNCLDVRDEIVKALMFVCITCHNIKPETLDNRLFCQGTAEFEAQLVGLLSMYEANKHTTGAFTAECISTAKTLQSYITDN